MNNRKPKNKRGKITREEFVQRIPEKKMIREKGNDVLNPNFPGWRNVRHHVTPKLTGGSLWGKKDK